MYKRLIQLEIIPNESFFLWGPRQAGKSTWLKFLYPDAHWVNLLKSDQYAKYLAEPFRLREELLRTLPSLVIIDEIQKVPQLLDEVHYLIENSPIIFGLCGSSARKVRRGHANLLGGRALRYQMFGLSSREVGKDFDLVRAVNFGYLPAIYDSKKPKLKLRSYVSDYLKEEIAAEGLTRNLPAFSRFLEVAALGDTDTASFTTMSRDCGVSAESIKNYYQILIDTLIGYWLPAYVKNPKRRVVKAPKFYFDDVGVVAHLAQRGVLQPGSSEFGKGFENYIFHELQTHLHYSEKYYDVFYWRLSSGIEVDFILGDMRYAIEVKSSKKITSDHLKGLRAIAEDYPQIMNRICVCLEENARVTNDGIEIMPVKFFLNWLWEEAFANSKS